MKPLLIRAFMLVAVFSGVLSAGASWANVISFEQAPVNGGLALFDDTGGFSFADDFSLATSTDLSEISWWGGYAGNALPSSSDFTISIYSDSGGKPGSVVTSYSPAAVGRTLTGLTGNDLTSTPESIYEFTYALPSVLTLTPGATYYLSIIDNTSAISSWLAGTGNGSSFVGDPSSNLWAAQSRDFAFELSSPAVVPEPTSMVILGGLISGLFVTRKLRRKNQL
ncbi:MAG: PEP-CTERM sorting domain-containing protein [Candidatus Hydrogenedentes bacterium]|nr:PEP-CTERM sorting domain-containing protein [Candidatus Hydrogenedentota bacterium]